MSVGILAALGTGEVMTSSLITLVVTVTELLEALCVRSAHRNIDDLVTSLPKVAVVIKAGVGPRTVPLSTVQQGDVVRVTAGGLVPVDGCVVRGSGYVDASSVTGESIPSEMVAGSKVFAGCILQSGLLEVRSTAVGSDTVFGQVVLAVQTAGDNSMPLESLSNIAARYIVYFAFASSGAALLATGSVQNAVSVLVVAGACGIAAGTPLAVLGGLGSAARGGAVVKGGRELEAMCAVDTVVFDKTGTLTEGRPRVTAHQIAPGTAFAAAAGPAPGAAEAAFLRLVFAAESRCDHPVAAAVAAYARALGAAAAGCPPVAHYAAESGLGVTCTVSGHAVRVGSAALVAPGAVVGASALMKAAPREWWSAAKSGASVVLVSHDGELVGALLVEDALRREAAGVVAALRARGLRPVIMSGDGEAQVAAVARQLGIEKFHANLSPLDKADLLAAMQRGGDKIAMVGDGINDAAAMAHATVGIAVGKASALTRGAADVVLLRDSLEGVTDAIDAATMTRRVVYQNICGTIAFDVIGAAAAGSGWLGPVASAAAHGIFDVVFILNSARLLLPRRRKEGASFCLNVKPCAKKQAVLDSFHLTAARLQVVLHMPALMKLTLMGDLTTAGGMRLPQQLQCLKLLEFEGQILHWPLLVKMELAGPVAGNISLPPSLTSLKTDALFKGALSSQSGNPLQHLAELALRGKPTGHEATLLPLSPDLRVLDLDVDLAGDGALQLPLLLEELVVKSHVTKPLMMPLPPGLRKVRMYAQHQKNSGNVALWRKDVVENLPAGVEKLVLGRALTRALYSSLRKNQAISLGPPLCAASSWRTGHRKCNYLRTSPR
ncbi:HAD-like domain-containing protein [Tribonema minus]|uniref:HAD-like domain-containing protein n=1 Tax=Tribonema minus TaxID=303371 RepID=A0A836CIP1_9STRA|nr:HAD-like domain-containing protein [Tribonema minus]